jgi:hypothetical protein
MKSRTSTLWVVVFDASRNELGFGRRFNVDITDATYVSDLKTTVKGIIGDRLSRVLASELDIWRCKDRTTLFVDDDYKLLWRQIHNAFSPEDKVEVLSAGQRLADLRISEKETLLVEVPPAPGTSRISTAVGYVLILP